MQQAIERIAKSLDSLPTLPIVALRVGEVLQGNNASVHQISQLLRTDPAISAKLLRVVNSAHFGVPGGVSDVARAIPFVGFAALSQLVLSIGVMDALSVSKSSFDAKPLWLHSLVVATAARELAADLKFADGGACFTAGLLHDMGKIALAKAEPEKLALLYASTREHGISLRDAEAMHELPHHEQIGARLARQWRLPATLAVPIEHHHDIHEPAIRGALATNLRTITEIVSAADLLALQCSPSDDRFIEDGSPEASSIFERNGLSKTQIDALCDRTRASLDKSMVFLDLLG